jgi:tRNA modification GTPase
MGEPILISLLTPSGRGAVAVVAVRGDRAVEATAARFHAAAGRPLASFPADQIVFGWWEHGSGSREEVVVCRRAGDEVEIHCHGGHAAAQAIIDHLVREEGRHVPWQAWVSEKSPGAIAAEAAVALSAARTERTAAILLDQQRGALEAAIQAILRRLDSADVDGAAAELDRLQSLEPLGMHLTQPWRVVLAGRPNVGKSSLINAILGYQRAIVFDQPGTTRDVLTAHTAIEGWPVELADTAGLRETVDPLEATGNAFARRRIADSDLLVLVFDRSRPWTADDEQLVREWPQGLVVHTKRDLAPGDVREHPPGLLTSAVTRAGLEDLLTAIANRLVPQQPEFGMAVPFTARQGHWLRAAGTALTSGDLERTHASLVKLLEGAGRPM